MSPQAYLRQIRSYASIALRRRVSYVLQVQELAQDRWATVRREVSDPAELEKQRMSIAVDAVRNYGVSDPQFQPDLDTALSWLEMPDTDGEPPV